MFWVAAALMLAGSVRVFGQTNGRLNTVSTQTPVTGLPPWPTGNPLPRLLFVNSPFHDQINQTALSQSYLFPALKGNALKLRMQPLDATLKPHISLTDLTGTVLADGADTPDDSTLEFTAPEDGWYIAKAGRLANSDGIGSFRVTLTGATANLYNLLPFGPPPPVAGDGVLMQSGTYTLKLTDAPILYAIPLRPDDTLTASVTGNIYLALLKTDQTMLTTPDANATPATSESVVNYTAPTLQWVLLAIVGSPGDQTDLKFSITDQTYTIVTPPAFLTDLATPTVTPAATHTPSLTHTPTDTPLPTDTYTYTPTPTIKPTRTPRPTLTPSLTPDPTIPPIDQRNTVPPGAERLGEFQVEWYCNNQGYGVILVNNQADWACTERKTNKVVFVLDASDFDKICQTTYNNPDAFAIQDQVKDIKAYTWSCYWYPQ
jgi:hypothetical protein